MGPAAGGVLVRDNGASIYVCVGGFLRTESHALPDADEHAAADEAPEIMPWSEGLHECSSYG